MVDAENNGRVGLFWLINKRLVVYSAALSESSKYGEFSIFEGDHITLWAEMERRGEVPRDSAYEEHPRGRVNFHTKTQLFTLFADPCILRKKNVVKKLISLMRLPAETALSTDGHYRCFRCLAGKHR